MSSLNPHNPESMICFDGSGDVVATDGIRVLEPWKVKESKQFQGRFFFLNSVTNESRWSLNSSLVIGASSDTSSVEPAELLSAAEDEDYVEEEGPGEEEDSGNVGDVKDIELLSLPIIYKNRSYSSPAPSSTTTSMSGAAVLTPKKGVVNKFRSRLGIPNGLFSDSDSMSLSGGGGGGGGGGNLGKRLDTMGSDSLYQVLDGLGQGGYATVVKVEHVITKQIFAMKVILKNDSSNQQKREQHQEQLAKELQFMTQISSPFLQKCHLAFESPTCVYFILDLYSGGDLFYQLVQKVLNNSIFSEKEVQFILAELYLALEHLHNHNIVHRDLKIENIMLDSKGHVKLIDFGLAIEIEQQIQPMNSNGSLIYMPPEMIKDKTGGRHTDWWAYGILAYELITGRTPWSSLTDTKIIKQEILSMEFVIPSDLSKISQKLISSLLVEEVERRLGFKKDSEIKNALFFKGINFNKLLKLQLCPGFIPDSVNVNPHDQKKALKAYYKTTSDAGSKKKLPKHQWSLGLDQASNYLY